MDVLSQLNFLFRKNKVNNWYIYFASAGIACLFYKNKYIFKKCFQSIYKLVKPDITKLVTNEFEGKYTLDLLNRKCHEIKVLGLDCEWITLDERRKPVALLQLATSDGYCSLFQLCQFDRIPAELFELLNNRNILKVGVAINNDAKYLMSDYGLKCDGLLDLRHLARHIGETTHGLAGLAKKQLGIELDKDWKIRCSDWEADCLTEQQITYAAQDARVAVEIFHKLNKKELRKNVGWLKCALWSKESYWENSLKIWKPYINLNFKEKATTSSTKSKSNKCVRFHQQKQYHTLSKVYYSNIRLVAPDGQVLCMIGESKAEWYLQRGLADVVNEDPKTVKLRFEPSARETDPNGYYTRFKKNICVVCGSDNSFRRKNIVPLEYRKLFPVHMKEHNSHNILLLCIKCHTISNFQDQELRIRLGYMCNAPLKETNNVKVKEIPELKSVRSAARALYLSSDVIPETRQNELKKVICEYLNIDSKNISNEILEELKDINPCVEQDGFVSHAQKVVDHFASDSELSLEQLQKLWRQHFVDTMSPKYLPELWSVDHKTSETSF